MKRALVIGIVILLIGMNAFTSAVNINKTNVNKTNYSINGTILYVGGNGSGNYTTIQSAIDDAVDGDTVFVYIGVYSEKLVVDKSINIIGENNTDTIIGGKVKILAKGVCINNFTFKSGLEIRDIRQAIISNNKFIGWSIPLINIEGSNDCIIRENLLESNEYLIDALMVRGSNISIIGNKILDNGLGIKLWGSYHTICDNIIIDNVGGGIFTNSVHHSNISNNFIQKCGVNGCGIELFKGNNNTICNNIIKNTACGIYLGTFPNNCLISGNIIHENKVGINVGLCYNINISGNSFENNKNKGLYIRDSFNISVNKNNFIGNERNAYFRVWNIFHGWITDLEELKKIATDNYMFDRNYWNRVSDSPIKIPGKIIISRELGDDEYSWSVFDFNPMKRPYNITGIENNPPERPVIDGPVNGKSRIKYMYTANTTDPDGDDISYFFDWGDDTNSGWTEYVSSGSPINLDHLWWYEGIFTIKVKVRDYDGTQSCWGNLTVTMPRDKATNNVLFWRLLERFPILQKLLLLIK